MLLPTEEEQAEIMAAWNQLPWGNYKARQVTPNFKPQLVGMTLLEHGVEYKEGRKSKTWIKKKN